MGAQVEPEVMVVATGVANIASMLAALRRAGGRPRLTHDAEQVRSADWVVLPGVGAFGAGMQRLREQELTEALCERVRQDRPLLAVCLGLQLLCRRSAESRDTAGLALLPADIERFSAGVTVPQIGWNRVLPQPGCRYLREGHAYFANSYRLSALPEGYDGAYGMHGERFVAGIERGGLLACQFHPELSGAWGGALLRRWLSGGEVASC